MRSVPRKTATAVAGEPAWAWNGRTVPELKSCAPWQEEDAHRHWAAYLRRSLRQRHIPGSPARLEPSWYLWGLHNLAQDESASQLLALARQIRRWNRGVPKDSPGQPPGWDALLELLPARDEPAPAWAPLPLLLLAWALPAAASWCPRQPWWGLLARLVEAAGSLDPHAPEQDPLGWQLLGGELPLLLSRQFPELEPLGSLAAQARRVLSSGLVRLCDGQGLLHGRHLELFPALLGCWTRCLLAHPHKPPWNTKAQDQYDWAVRQMLRLLRPDRSWSFGPAVPLSADRQLVQQALLLAGDRYDRAMAQGSLPPAWKKLALSPPGEKPPRVLPPASYQSDWAEAALLQPHWDHRCPRLWVNHAGRACLVELSNQGRLLLQGEVQLQLCRNGEQLHPRGEWSCVLWEADADGDYLELELELSQRTTLYRHLFLAREDRFLLLADAVLGPEAPAEWDYRLLLPLAANVGWQQEAETTEGVLRHGSGRTLALAMPLAAPEWKIACRYVPLQQHQGQLVLRHSQRGRNLVVPLFFDLDPRRLRRQRTWRRLTVAQERQVVDPDRACGFRIQSGRDQWVLYRSLDGVHNRTLLGINVFCELSLRRFLPDGLTELLIETLPE